MLASCVWPPVQDRYNAYLPPRPSPLSPRSANARRPYHHQTISMPKQQSSPSRLKFKDVPFSKRPIKQNPFSQRARDPSSREAAREARRKLFLQQVAQKREDRRFEERGDHLLRLDWRSERRRWEDDQARRASTWSDQLDEEDGPLASQREQVFAMSPQKSLANTANGNEHQISAEAAAAAEEAEVEELLALMDEQESQLSSRYGSDDEYDGIFSELVEDDGGGVLMEDDGFVVVERQGDVDMSG